MPGSYDLAVAFASYSGGTEVYFSGPWTVRGQWWQLWQTDQPKATHWPYLQARFANFRGVGACVCVYVCVCVCVCAALRVRCVSCTRTRMPMPAKVVVHGEGRLAAAA